MNVFNISFLWVEISIVGGGYFFFFYFAHHLVELDLFFAEPQTPQKYSNHLLMLREQSRKKVCSGRGAVIIYR